MTKPSRSSARPLLAACAVAAATAATGLALARLERSREQERASVEAHAAALRAGDALRALLSSFEVQVQNASTNPRLGAALDADVDRKTLLDLLLTEPWWEPFRRSVDGHGLVRVRDGARFEASAGLPDAAVVAPLVARVGAGGRATSALRVVGGQTLMLAAAPVALAGRREVPVLVASKRLGVGTLAAVAQRANGTIAITDQTRVLISTTATGLEAEAEDFMELRRMLALPVGTTQPSAGNRALAAVPLGGELRLVVRAAAAAPAAGTTSWALWATLAIGFLAALCTYAGVSRRSASGPAPELAAGPRRPVTLTSVGRYAIVNRIGQGGMAEIYAAVSRGEEGFKRPIVIKRLRPELSDDPTAVAQFCDEANLLAALHHPNIVSVQDFGRAGDELFLAEEYVQGRDLGRIVERSLVRDGRPPSPSLVAHVCYELLEALDYAHHMCGEAGQPLGIVHRDVSPDNIMVSARGEVKLLDFGVVKSAEGRLSKTEFGVIKGNVMFMSPEQARGESVDARADVYAVALVMHYALTGRPLYRAQTTYGLLVEAGTGPDLRELAAARDVPAAFRPILQRALAPQIEDRYQSARELAADLERLVGRGQPAAGAEVTRLFKDELEGEARRLAAFVPAPEAAPMRAPERMHAS